MSDRKLLPIADEVASLLDALLTAPLAPEVTLTPAPGGIHFEVNPELPANSLGDEAYSLQITDRQISVRASSNIGAFNALQTLKQLVLEADAGRLLTRSIDDAPRFAHRGFMLDVARHFHPVGTVKRVIDRMAALKFNVLHLHLSDDQGWRIEINSRPNLVSLGSTNEVGGGAGGHYTRADWDEILRYAAARFILVIPEIDLPGHTNAALVAHPELAPAGVVPVPYTGTKVGFSTLDTKNPESLRFVRDVLAELCEMTPGPYIHIGGDESFATSSADYRDFMTRVVAIVFELGKTPIGWHELGQCDAIEPGTVGQYWGFSGVEGEDEAQLRAFVDRGDRVILSPSDRVYLDIKNAHESPLGTLWHGKQQPTTLYRAYDWEPGTLIQGVEESDILGIEAALWTEQASTLEEIDALLFPRLAATAEIAWSPAPGVDAPLRTWASFSERVSRLTTIWAKVHNPAAQHLVAAPSNA